MLPSFIILGAQKSATTFVQRALARHPDVFMVPGEVRFFEDPEYGRSRVAELERLFDHAGGASARGMKRADYLARPEVPVRIRKHLPTARLLIILRNPVARAVSAYFHLIKLGFLPALDLEEGMARVLDGSLAKEYPKCKEIVEYGLYGRQVERYLKHFDRRQMLILLHEEVVQSSLESIRAIYDFLGVDASFRPPSLGRRSNPGIYSMTRLRWLARQNRFRYRYSNDRMKIESHRVPLGNKLAAVAVTGFDRFILAHLSDNEKPTLSEPVRSQLLDVYRSDLALLGSLLGSDLSAWWAETRR